MEALAEIKDLIQKTGSAHEEFKKSVDEKIKALEKKGSVDPLIEEKLKKINTDLDALGEQKARLEKIEVALKRFGGGNPGGIQVKVKLPNGEEIDRPDDWNEVKDAYNLFLRKGKGGADSDGGQVFGWEKKTLSVSSDSDGGFTVTADLGGRIVTKIFETSAIRDVASVQVIGTGELEGGYDDDEASSGWVSERGSRPETNAPKMGKWKIPVHEQYAMPSATQRVLDDSNIAIESWLAGKVSDKFSRVENTAFCTGTGIGQPRGFLTYPSGTTLRTQVQQIGSGSSGAFVADKLFDVVYALKAGYRRNAQWAFNRTSIGKLRQLYDSQHRFYWEPSLQNGEPARLLGYPIQEFNDLPDPAASSLSGVFADWKEFYQIVDRAGIRVLRDPYTSKGFVLFYTTKRVGGDVLNTEAGKVHILV